MSTLNIEDLIGELGGCGRFQWLTTLIIQLSRTMVSYTMLAMTFNGQQPDFTCISRDLSNMSLASNGTRAKTPISECNPNNVTCEAYEFYTGDMKTIVNEWDLVCDRKWIVAMITTLQMLGVLVGCFICGHLGDTIGRKPTYIIAMSILIVFNVAAFFCPNWQIYAVIRLVLGVGIGFFITVQYNLMTEFMPTLWRPRAMALPAWALVSGSFALVIWILRDWKKVHLAAAAAGLPFILSFGFLQESFRWLVPKGKYEQAASVVDHIARVNKKGTPDIIEILAHAEDDMEKEAVATYSIIDLFKTAKMTKTTLTLCLMWLSISYAYYGLTFGVRTLAGDLYLNIFLTNIIEAPVSLCMMFVINRVGRKFPLIFFFLLTGVFGFIVGVIQYIAFSASSLEIMVYSSSEEIPGKKDTPARGTVTNVFALGSRITLSCGWYFMMVISMELYPTVVRTIGYGLCNTAARIGGMLAPQIVFLNDDIPGLLYFLSGGLMIISGLLCFSFPETKGQGLVDRLEHKAKMLVVNNEKTTDDTITL